MGIFARIGTRLHTWAHSGTTQVNFAVPGLLPHCLPNTLANYCLTYARDIWGAKIVFVIPYGVATEIAVYELKPQPCGWMKTCYKVAILIIAYPLGMILRTLSIYNVDVRDSLRAETGLVLTDDKKAEETPLEEEEEDYFDFETKPSIPFRSPFSKALDFLISLLKMDEEALEAAVQDPDFKAKILQCGQLPKRDTALFLNLYASVQNKIRQFGLKETP